MSSLRHIATEPANLSQKLAGNNCPDEVNHERTSSHSDSDVSNSTASISQASLQSEPPPQMKSSLTLNLPVISALEAEENEENTILEKKKVAPNKRRQMRRGSEWEILEGLRDGQRFEEKPEKFEGYMMKRRKWPLKGWHKRYFCCDKGILTYSKSSTEMARGKIHGTVDVGLSVISSKPRHRRIDIDAEEFIYHLKVKNNLLFHQWIAQLRRHRLYRQNEIAFGTREAPKITTPVEETPVGVFHISGIHNFISKETPTSRQSNHVRSPIGQQNRVAAWILDSSAIDQGNKEIALLQDKLFQLNTIIQHLEVTSNTCIVNHLELPEMSQNNLKKERRRFLLRRKKNAKTAQSSLQNTGFGKTLGVHKKGNKQKIEIVVLRDTSVSSSTENISDVTESNQLKKVPSGLSIKESAHLSCSHPSLVGDVEFSRPHSLPDSSSMLNCALTDSASSCSQNSLQNKYHEEFLCLAKEIHSGLRSMLRSLHTERERLKQILENEGLPSESGSGSLITTLKNSLNQALMQNKDLRMRLQQIHTTSDVGSTTTYISGTPTAENADESTLIHQPLQPSLSHESSSVLSASEYFDAEENLSSSTSSSEASLSDDAGSFLSDVSEEGTEYTPIPSVSDMVSSPTRNTGRRSKLPAPKPDLGDFSLWNLLCKNIGKDLSKVSMPVTLNEPINVLQRLCEELEYSELLDKAADTIDPYEKMVYIAAFAVSAYSASYYRAGHKPFNPLLGETYECIREDRGFRFIAEQVSHHPPISACYAESRNYIFWQDMRVKTKFWGKSMEILPIGSIHVLLPRTGDEYQWNKVTTCVHNLFSGQRWVDQYGEMIITDKVGEVNCKLNFVKASYWSNKRHEVYGTISTNEGEVIHNLFGKWTEALYCGVAPTAKCVWRPGAMPQDYEMYYGFTTFAMELNELDPDMVKLLPPTDTRLRPDQRLLEEGNIQVAETIKTQLEQAQRERRKKREEENIEHIPMWFKKHIEDGREAWVYTHKYWETRSSPGFVNITFPVKIW